MEKGLHPKMQPPSVVLFRDVRRSRDYLLLRRIRIPQTVNPRPARISVPSMYEPPDPVLTATEHPPPPEPLERSIEPPGAAAVIDTEKSFVEEAPSAPATRTAKLEVPAAVGVPSRTPVADRLRPAGSVPEDTDQVYGTVPPVAVSVWL
jgi:hypothetical protein